MTDNFYNILGVNEDSTEKEIKTAYRKLQMKYHPDKNPGNQEANDMTQKINEAYETLGDEHKRQEYDSLRKNPFLRMNGHMQGGGGGGDPMEDILNAFFGGGMGIPGFPPGMGFHGPGFPPGAKIHVFHGPPGNMGFHQALQKPTPIVKNIEVSIDKVLTGTTLPLEIERWVIENGNKLFEQETVYVTVPEGIDDNEMIILRDKGNVINEMAKGDIKIFVKVINNTPFKRSGLDLILEKNISLKDALCGFSFELNYINGRSYTLNNNKGNIIPPEYRKIYPDMGLKRGEHKGNMIIIFHLDFPQHLSDDKIQSLSEIL
jgi:DnaJ-class molecular chaperone